MAVTAYPYTNGAKGFINGTYSWKTSGGSNFKVALLTSSYTPNQDTHDFYDDISGVEVANGNGYTTGGAALTTADPTVDTATNETRLDAGDVTWSTSTITARYAVVYQDTGTPSTSALICYIDFGEDKSSSAGDFTIEWHANGIVKFTAAAPA